MVLHFEEALNTNPSYDLTRNQKMVRLVSNGTFYPAVVENVVREAT